jgi:hypothetical protein
LASDSDLSAYLASAVLSFRQEWRDKLIHLYFLPKQQMAAASP